MRNKIAYSSIASEVDAFAESSFKEEGGGVRFKDAVMYYAQNKNIKSIASATVGLIEEALYVKTQRGVILISGLAYPYEDLFSIVRVFIRLIASSSLDSTKTNDSASLDLGFFRSSGNFTRVISHFVRSNDKNLLNETLAEISGTSVKQLQSILKDGLNASDGIATKFISSCKARGMENDPSGLLLGIRQNRKNMKQIIALKYADGLTLRSLPNLVGILTEFRNYYWNTFKLTSFYAVSAFFDDGIAKSIFVSEAGAAEFFQVVLNPPRYQATLPDWAMPGGKNR